MEFKTNKEFIDYQKANRLRPSFINRIRYWLIEKLAYGKLPVLMNWKIYHTDNKSFASINDQGLIIGNTFDATRNNHDAVMVSADQ